MWKRRHNLLAALLYAERRGGRRGAAAAVSTKRPGQSLVEFALVLGVLLLIILGGIDAVQILMTQYTVNQAVRASAHQAALVGGPDGSSGNVATSSQTPQNTIAKTGLLINLLNMFLFLKILNYSAYRSNFDITAAGFRNW